MTQGVHTGIRFLFLKTKIIKKFKNKVMNLFQKILKFLRHWKLQLGVTALLATFTLWACRDEASTISSPIDMPSSGEGIVQLKYTAEIMTHVETDAKGGKLTGLEEIQAVPNVTRVQTAMVVFEDGTCDLEIKQLTPKNQPIKFNDLTPPDRRPKAVVTRIERNGTAHLFDKDNNEIQTFGMPQRPDLKQWVEILKKEAANVSPSELVSYVFGNKVGGVRATIAEARKNGGEVIPNSDGTVFVRVGKSSNGLGTRNASQTFSESVIDTVQNTVRAAAIFDKQSSKMLGKMAYTYKDVNGSKELTHIYLESYNPNSPDNRRQKAISVTELSDVSVKINR
jgi:hypothetical protein